jgi:hypothetical protein
VAQQGGLAGAKEAGYDCHRQAALLLLLLVVCGDRAGSCL